MRTTIAVKKRAAKGIYTRLIFQPCNFAERVHAQAKEYKITIRFLPSRFTWQSGTFYGTTTLQFSHTQSKSSHARFGK
jgi:hypothetical protein